MKPRSQDHSLGINRRTFVGTLSLAAGGLATASIFSSLVDATLPFVPAPAPWATSGPLDDWTIDDMVAPYPRYAEVVQVDRTAPLVDHSDPLDHL